MLPREEVPRELRRYLTPDEKVVFVQRQHWIAIAEPVASAVGSFILLIFLVGVFDNSPGLTNLLIIGWFVWVARCAWKLAAWHFDLFVGTSSRLVNVSGLVSRKVAMMPLAKVTDMSYMRSPWAKVLGWGTFRLESAGQDQALGTIKFVNHPDETYRKITGQLFKPAARRATDVRPPVGSGSQLPVVEPDDAWWRRP